MTKDNVTRLPSSDDDVPIRSLDHPLGWWSHGDDTNLYTAPAVRGNYFVWRDSFGRWEVVFCEGSGTLLLGVRDSLSEAQDLAATHFRF
jgi:hypothetical protein